MNYSLTFLPQAKDEIIDSIIWYNSKKANLGFEFNELLSDKLNLISHHPLHYSIRFKKFRASKLSKFPYLIYFKVDEANKWVCCTQVEIQMKSVKENKYGRTSYVRKNHFTN